MEEGSFLKVKLNSVNLSDLASQGIDFTSSDARSEDAVHTSPQRDTSTRHSLDSLISQNEDLMARLKVALKHLHDLEKQNTELKVKSDSNNKNNQFYEDQLLVWKEKEKQWTSKLQTLEKEKQRLLDKEKLFSLQQVEVDSLHLEIERHKKFYDKVKTQIEPYMKQLKEFSQQQDQVIKNLEKQLQTKESQYKTLKHKMIDLSQMAKQQIQHLEVTQRDLIESYESKKKELEVRNLELEESAAFFEKKSAKLEEVQELNTILENDVIDLKRKLEDETLANQENKNESARLRTQTANLNNKLHDKEKQITEIENKNSLLESQLESLRFLFDEKTSETEKLKLAIQSLEKINGELSIKLNESRQTKSVDSSL